MTELDLLKKEIKELKDRLISLQLEVAEWTQPPNLYLRNLAREVASGNIQALKEHNKRRLGNARR